MSEPLCAVHNKKVDTALAERLNFKDPYMATAYRNLYIKKYANKYGDLKLEEASTDEELAQALTDAELKIRKMLASINEETSSLSKAVFSKKANKASWIQAYERLKNSFPAEDRYNRINAVAGMFTKILDNLPKQNPAFAKYSRQELCNGITVNGKVIVSQEQIFNRVFKQLSDNLMKVYQTDYLSPDAEAAVKNRYNAILENFPVLVTFAKRKLLLTEGISFGDSVNYALEADESNYTDIDVDLLMNAEEQTAESYQQIKEFIPAFSSLNLITRRILSHIQDYHYKGENPVLAVDDLGFPINVNPVYAHRLLVYTFLNSRNPEHFLSKLEESVHPWAPALVKVLKDNPKLLPAFYGDFKKNFQKGCMVKTKDGNFVTVQLNKSTNYFLDRVKANLALSIPVDATTIFNEGGKISATKVASLKNLISQYFKVNNTDEEKGNEPENFITNIFDHLKEKKNRPGIFWYDSIKVNNVPNKDKQLEIVQEVLKALGIDVSNKTLEPIARNKALFDSLVYEIGNFSYALTSISSGTEIETIDGENYFKDLTISESFFSKTVEGNESVLAEKYAKLLDFLSEHALGSRIENRHSYKGKARNSSMAPNFMGSFIEDVKGFIDDLRSLNYSKTAASNLKNYLFNRYGASSQFFNYGEKDEDGNPKAGRFYNKILQELFACADPKKINKVNNALYMLDYMRLYGDESEDFEDFTQKTHAESFLTFYFSDQEQSSGKRKDSGWYPVFILGDAGCQKFLKFKRYPAGKDNNTELLEAFYDLYLSERNRLAQTKGLKTKLTDLFGKDTGSEQYITDKIVNNGKELNLDKFNSGYTLLKFLNDYRKTLTAEQQKDFDENGVTKDVFMELLKKSLEEEVKNFKTNLIRLGVLEKDSSGKPKVFKKLLANIPASETEKIDTEIDKLLADYYLNTKLNKACQLQIFDVDPGFYDNVKNLQKRNKQIHASGTEMDIHAKWEDENGNLVEVAKDPKHPENDYNESFIYFDDELYSMNDIDEDFMKVIENVFGADSETYNLYAGKNNNSLTDGQGYRTLASYRKVMIMSGKWNADAERTYKEIQSLRARARANDGFTPEDKKRLTELAVIFQPIKPFYYGFEQFKINNNPGGTVYIPVQHKYAEVVLIPELYAKDSRLRLLGEAMERKGIDLAGTSTIAKVGAYACINLKDMKVEEMAAHLNNILDKCIHRLPYTNYRIQNNVPAHMDTDNLFGTQVRKLIMSGLDMLKTYTYKLAGNHEIKDFKISDSKNASNTGKGLIQLYNSVIISNIIEAFDTFESAVGDIDKLKNRLIQNVISNDRETMDNLFAYSLTLDDKFLLPLFEGNLEHDSFANISSIFRKAVNKQKIRGGSMVQASAFGLTKEEKANLKFMTNKAKTNIVYAEVEMPWSMSFKRNGIDVQLDYDKYCYPDGSLKLSDIEISESDPEWELNQSYVKVVNGVKKVFKPLIEVDYPDILTTIAYRIPTERDYSMIHCRTKRFSPKVTGGVMRVPLQGTTIAGFDFDIDKLYFMRKEFEFEKDSLFKRANLSQDQLKAVMSKIKELHPEYVKNNTVTEEAFSEAQKKEIFKHIYQKPENFKLYQELRKTRDASGEYTIEDFVDAAGHQLERRHYKKSLASYFEQCEFIKRLAASQMYNMSVKEFKAFLFQEAVVELGLAPDTVKESAGKYLSFDNEAIEAAGVSKAEMFREAAKDLGIQLSEINDSPILKTYNPNISPAKNSRTQRNNLLIDIIKNRLMDPETLKQRLTPGGFDIAKKAARVMRELLYSKLPINDILNKALENSKDKNADPEPEYDPTNPMTDIIFNQLNQVAGKLIGIAANQNAHHAFCSLMKTFELHTGIQFAGHKEEKDFLHKTDGRMDEVEKAVSEFLAAAVDAVKDPVLNYLNLNTITADAGIVLARLGYNTTEIGLLFNQPSIKNLCDKMFNSDMKFTEAFNEIKNSYTSAGLDWDLIDTSYLTTDIMAKAFYIGRNESLSAAERAEAIDNMPDYAKSQLAALKLFSQLKGVTDDVTAFVQCTRYTAANSVGSTAGDLYAQRARVEDFLKKFKKNSDGKSEISFKLVLNDAGTITTPINLTLLNECPEDDFTEAYLEAIAENPFGYEQCMFDMNQRFIRIISKYFPYEQPFYKVVRGALKQLSRYGNINADMINAAHKELVMFILSKIPGSKFNGDTIYKDDMTMRQFYEMEFPKEYAAFNSKVNRDKLLKSNPIFEYFYPSAKNSNGKLTYSIKGFETANSQLEIKDTIIDGWNALYNNPQTQELAEKLFFYAYYTNGFNFGPSSFMHLVPTELKTKLISKDYSGDDVTYTEFLNSLLSDSGVLDLLNAQDVRNFAMMHMLNHSDDYHYVKTISEKSESYKKIVSLLNVNPEEFTISDVESSLGKNVMAFVRKDGETYKFTPLIKIGEYLYMANNGTNSIQFNTNKVASMTYKRIEPLNGNTIKVRYGNSLDNLQEYIKGKLATPLSANTLFESGLLGNTTNSQNVEPVGPEDNDNESSETLEGTSEPSQGSAQRLSEDTESLGFLDSMESEKVYPTSEFRKILRQEIQKLLNTEEVKNNSELSGVLNQCLGIIPGALENDVILGIANGLREQFKQKGCITLNSDGTFTKMC